MVGSNPHFVQTEGDEIEVYDVSGRIYQFNRVQNEFEEIANAAIAINSYYQLNDVCKDGNTYWIAMSEGILPVPLYVQVLKQMHSYGHL